MRLREALAAVVACAVTIAILIVFGGFDSDSPRTCVDGWHSPSIGIQGACSHHGGVKPRKQSNTFLWLGAIFAGLLTFSGLAESTESKNRNSQISNTETKNRISQPPTHSEAEKTTNNDAVICPECGAQMKLRTAGKGRYKGSQFWGCSKYPKCKAIINIKH
jgi:Topoisomerase DNA binding C4 zinc finger